MKKDKGEKGRKDVEEKDEEKKEDEDEKKEEEKEEEKKGEEEMEGEKKEEEERKEVITYDPKELIFAQNGGSLKITTKNNSISRQALKVTLHLHFSVP